jgi:oxygen-dependent protoporphyrinogen oxidase
MKRVAIIGGGISGVTAAYQLEQQRRSGTTVDWHLYEAGNRLGGIVETTQRDGFVLEGGPDGWVSEKPWARDLAIELGLESQLIYSNDATRKTYILIDDQLQPMPDRMRMMVPEDLSTLEASPLFSGEACAAYAAEVGRAEELRKSAPSHDESVASFVLRHFGEEVLAKIAAPLLSGVFGGDVAKLSVRSVMPAFVVMEREYGSLIAALQAKSNSRAGTAQQPIFTSLRSGVGSLVDAMVATLPPVRIHLASPARSIARSGVKWGVNGEVYDAVMLATPVDVTRSLLHPIDAEAATLLPKDASSAVLAALAWPEQTARTFTIPSGFGFLVPASSHDVHQLLACTFVEQKFTQRAPGGARVLRAFFGGSSADTLEQRSDEAIQAIALEQLRAILGPMPNPEAGLSLIRRWPRNLPQYEVGHLDRMAQLDQRITRIPGLALLGNSYRGVGLPDLIRDARKAADELCILS